MRFLLDTGDELVSHKTVPKSSLWKKYMEQTREEEVGMKSDGESLYIIEALHFQTLENDEMKHNDYF